VTPLEQWLSDATRGLSAESAARVRAEIQQHYDSAREAGGDADDVMRALGDPRAANRAYRKVLLTEQEAMLAPTLTQPKRPGFQGMLLSATLMAALVWWLSGKHHGPGFWPITIAIFCNTPLIWLFPLTTLERSRIYLYIDGLRSIVVVGLAWWYQGWIGGLSLGVLCFSFAYFFGYRRLAIFRKLAAGQTWSLLPEEPELTHLEAIHLNTLRKGSPYEHVSIAVLFLMLTGMAVWQPATFAPMTAWMTAGFLARRTLSIYTEERSRWFRIAKWTTMGVAALLPPLYGARVPWIGAAELAFFFFIFDMKSISLRRKLPVAEWPKRLYW
jgi:hypothetical protein